MFTDMIQEASSNSTAWSYFVSRNANEKTKRFIRFIDDVYNKGLDDAYIKHFDRNTQSIEEWY